MRHTNNTQNMSKLISMIARTNENYKLELYRELVIKRKACHRCHELTNPGDIADGLYDSDHIGPWSCWQGNLNAPILIMGQDWGDCSSFVKQQGFDSPRSMTNMVLTKLLASIGYTISPPSDKITEGELFFTNAVLCLKENGAQAPVKQAWFSSCVKYFLKPLIQIVSPRAVVSLGKEAYLSMCNLYGLPKMKFKQAIEAPEGFHLSHGTIYFPMYHCGARILNTYRSYNQQVNDWQRLRTVLTNRG